jgi:hypothetical protein
MASQLRTLAFLGLALFSLLPLGEMSAADKAAKLAQPVNWGTPDQPYGKRRPVTDADRSAIQSYRSGRKSPIFSTNFTDAAELQTDWILMSDDGRVCRRPGNVETTSGGLRLKTLAAQPDCHNKSLHWSTGSMQSKAHYRYGFFEATMKIADIKGMNNAFWMNTQNQPATGDYFEIDVSEVQYPAMTTSTCSSTQPKRTTWHYPVSSTREWDGEARSRTTFPRASTITAYSGALRN